jgi:hypothetical protein
MLKILRKTVLSLLKENITMINCAIRSYCGEGKMMPTSARKERLRVILDSNALFVPLQFKIDVFSELERVLNRSFELILL